tara:strand:+ start:522 stop:962 length:441 start_codon:yes stop_codon:yes gene_type:complete
MKLTNKSYIFLLLFFFVSCVAKKSTIEYKERIVKDTIFTETIKTVFKDVKQTLYVDSPCDSIGTLKPFEKTIITPKAKIKLYSEKGSIKVDVNIDSIVDLKVSEFKSKYKSKVEIKEVEIVRYRLPIWLVLSLVVSVLLNVLLIRK